MAAMPHLLHSPESLRHSLRGVVVPIVTPFLPDGDIDEAGFDRHVDWLVSEHVHGILVADLVGEAWALTVSEKAALFQRAVQVVAGRVPVIAKLSETALRAQRMLAEAARGAGVDVVKAVLPAWPATDDEQAYEYLMAAVAPAGLPFMIETSGADVSLAVLSRCAEAPGFIGLEDASLNLDRFTLLVDRFAGHGPVFGGAEDVLACHLLLGGAGFMTAAPNFAPRFMLEAWQAAAEGRHHDVLDHAARLRGYRRLLAPELRAGRPAFASYAKAALDLIGRPVGAPRPPLRPLSTAERDALAVTLSAPSGFALTIP